MNDIDIDNQSNEVEPLNHIDTDNEVEPLTAPELLRRSKFNRRVFPWYTTKVFTCADDVEKAFLSPIFFFRHVTFLLPSSGFFSRLILSHNYIIK